MSKPAELTVVANFHREGALVYPALASAFLAVEAAARHGVGSRVLAVLDRADDATRDEVARFSDRLHGTLEINAGDLSTARNLGLHHVDTPWAALLDGDDLFDRNWLWKGLRHLQEDGRKNAVAHSRVRLAFGSERHGRVQISSESPFFHPLNLIASWHWAADTIAPIDLFRNHPYVPNDHASGFGGEDWLWNCETLAAGVRHLVVPETVYFYRRQARHVSLGMVPGITFRPTRLLDADRVASSLQASPSAALSFADRLEEPTGPAERWSTPPGWLRAAVRRASRLDLDVHALGRDLSTVPLETPPLFPGVGHLYLKLMRGLGEGRERVVLLCDRLTPSVLGPIEGFLRALGRSRSPHLDVLVVSLAVPNAPTRAPDFPGALPEHSDTPWLRLRHVDLGADAAYQHLWEGLRQDLLVRFLLQVRPLVAAGVDSWAFDRFVSRWGDALRSTGIRMARILGSRHRGDDGFLEALRLLDRCDAGYSILACADAEVARRVKDELPLPGQTAVAPTDGENEGEGATGALLLGFLDASAAPASPAEEQREVPPLEAAVPDVTCILVVRSEGRHLLGTIRSLARALRVLRRAGRKTEVLVVAVQPGPRTREVLRSLSLRLPGARLVDTDFLDEASAVNAGVSAALGRHVALVTGGYAVTPGFLLRALHAPETQGQDVIARPGLLVEPGETLDAVEQADMRDEGLDIGLLACGELWAPIALARRELLLRFPWRTAAPDTGFGQSAWHWTCETVHGGCLHIAVPKTAVFRLTDIIGERDLTLGPRGWPALLPSRFFTDHRWLTRSASRSVVGTSGLPRDWNDAAYLNAYPDVAAAIRFGQFSSGWAHFCLHGHDEGRVAAWRRVPGQHVVRDALRGVRLALGARVELWRRAGGTALGSPGGGPQAPSAWLARETTRLAASVPLLAGKTLSAGVRHLSLDPSARDAYRASWRVLSAARPTHVLLVPRLGPGGGELASTLCVDAILSRPQNRVLVVSTDSEDDGRRAGLPDGASFLPFAALAAGCPPEEQVEVLTRLLVNSSARSLHVFYSHVGWEVLRRHSAALAQRLRIFVSIFSVPAAGTGLDAGYARLLPPLRRHVTSVFTDNQRAADALALACGLESDQVAVLRHPVSPRVPFQGSVNGSDRVLWAGRLDADKRPELLREIAERLPRTRFDVWGSPVLDDGRLFAPLASLPNVRLRGPFAGFASIPDAPYHCFLYTSLWDGLPNVLLEAVASGLLAVGSDVGAVREVLGDRGGILVRPPDDARAYVEAIEQSFRDPGAARARAERGRQRVVKTHTREGFLASLASVPGYL